MARTVRTNGARVVQLYLDAGLTQDELAQQCGCMPSTVRKAERGGPVALSVLREIAEVLDVPFRELRAGSGGPIAGTSDAWSEGWPDRLVGSWSGRLDQPAGPGGQPFHGEFRIRFVRTAAGATAHYTFAYGSTTYECAGNVTRLFERYFRLDATTDDPGRCLFNTVYFQVIPAGDQLHGWYVGLGPHSNGIVTGTATAFKDPANAGVNGPSLPAARRQSSRVAGRREKASRRGE